MLKDPEVAMQLWHSGLIVDIEVGHDATALKEGSGTASIIPVENEDGLGRLWLVITEVAHGVSSRGNVSEDRGKCGLVKSKWGYIGTARAVSKTD